LKNIVFYATIYREEGRGIFFVFCPDEDIWIAFSLLHNGE